MKFYLVLFLVSFGAQAGLFKSDFLLEKDTECILDLSKVPNRNYMIPDKHVLNCIVHNKNKNLRICEVGDEFAIKDDPNRKLMVKFFKFKGKFVHLETDDNLFPLINADKIIKVTKNLSCKDRLNNALKNRDNLIRNYYYQMYVP